MPQSGHLSHYFTYAPGESEDMTEICCRLSKALAKLESIPLRAHMR
jgi:hypothetical protein